MSSDSFGYFSYVAGAMKVSFIERYVSERSLKSQFLCLGYEWCVRVCMFACVCK